MERIGNMLYQEQNGVGMLTFADWEQLSFVNAAFSTRKGGVSEREFSSMNLAFGRGDPDEHVLENYRRFCAAAGFSYEMLVSSAQVHDTVIRRVGSANAGCGVWNPQEAPGTDGLVTDEPGVVLVTHYADCVPLYFADPEHRCIGLAHAGWRGTVAEMGRKMVEKMQAEFGTRPEALYAAIGPSIGSCCYEVDTPVAEQFSALPDVPEAAILNPQGAGKYRLNLWECNRRILENAGIPANQITVGGVCTMCHSDLLFSHRATGGVRGGLSAFLSIRV